MNPNSHVIQRSIGSRAHFIKQAQSPTILKLFSSLLFSPGTQFNWPQLNISRLVFRNQERGIWGLGGISKVMQIEGAAKQ